MMMMMGIEDELADDVGGLVPRRVVGPLATNCWIIAGIRDRRAVIVDPRDEPQRIIDASVDLDLQGDQGIAFEVPVEGTQIRRHPIRVPDDATDVSYRRAGSTFQSRNG